ncbi:hypothetical protein TRVL_05090 [Trypanosoma vivax]|nr:hypothetical protein TRVL_05090 [Trypanosoma vivax]
MSQRTQTKTTGQRGTQKLWSTLRCKTGTKVTMDSRPRALKKHQVTNKRSAKALTPDGQLRPMHRRFETTNTNAEDWRKELRSAGCGNSSDSGRERWPTAEQVLKRTRHLCALTTATCLQNWKTHR